MTPDDRKFSLKVVAAAILILLVGWAGMALMGWDDKVHGFAAPAPPTAPVGELSGPAGTATGPAPINPPMGAPVAVSGGQQETDSADEHSAATSPAAPASIAYAGPNPAIPLWVAGLLAVGLILAKVGRQHMHTEEGS
jgi:hypothetical protein